MSQPMISSRKTSKRKTALASPVQTRERGAIAGPANICLTPEREEIRRVNL